MLILMTSEICTTTQPFATSTETDRVCTSENSLIYYTQFVFDLFILGIVAFLVMKFIKR